eukprot:7389146-Prymnesium_polylepis.1
MSHPSNPSPSLVLAAARRLAGRVVRTPLLEAPLLNRLVGERRGVGGVRVLVKAEALQHTGAFKFRGALNRLLADDMDEAARARGVVAFSSGNFAQALALASSITETKCTIVSPHDAPALKVQRTKAYGAEVLLSTPAAGENREVAAAAMAARFADEHGAKLLHPFDDWPVIYGQGSLAVELFEQAADSRVATLVVPCGGGGMLAGCSLAAEALSPSTRLFAVEPEGYDDHCRSLRSGQRTPLEGPPATTICDALQASAPGRLTWEVNGGRLGGAAAASDEAAREAMGIAFTELKLALEPSGALGLAALLDGSVPLADGDVVAVVACGGNVDLRDFVRLLA